MKATINGITVEGTAEEVWAILQKSNAQGTNLKPVQPMPHWDGAWWSIFPPHQQTGTGVATTPDYLKWPHVVSMNLATGAVTGHKLPVNSITTADINKYLDMMG